MTLAACPGRRHTLGTAPVSYGAGSSSPVAGLPEAAGNRG
jgi:hypothetical protein